MRTSNKLLILSLVVLYGCQPETPAPQPVVSAPVEQAVQPAASEVTAADEEVPQPTVAEIPLQSPQVHEIDVPATKPAPATTTVAKIKAETPPSSVVAEVKAEAPPAPVVAEVKAETPPAPVVAEVKAEVPSEPVVSEAEAMQLAKKNNCFACHAVGKKIVGPSFKDIAAKYRGNPEAEALMMHKIAKGSSGVWGAMVMPPSPKINETDIRVLAKLVLSSK